MPVFVSLENDPGTEIPLNLANWKLWFDVDSLIHLLVGVQND